MNRRDRLTYLAGILILLIKNHHQAFFFASHQQCLAMRQC